jgi:pimeloyl-ACP methyl ester carboxylesterase
MTHFEIDGVRLAVSESGSGRPVVMLHCSASSGSAWRGVTHWMGRGVRAITPDFYGCGASERWQRQRPVQIGDHVKLVEAIAHRYGGPIDVVGHSFGGAVALRAAIALQQEGRLQSLTLIEPVSFHLLRDGSAVDRRLFDQAVWLYGQIRASILDNDADRGMGRFVDYWNGPASWDRLDAETRHRLSSRLGPVADDFAAAFSDTTTIDAYGAITAPTMLIGGSLSPAPTQRLCQLLSVAIPGAEHVTITAGHMSPMTHPAVIGALIASHLDYAQPQPRRVA